MESDARETRRGTSCAVGFEPALEMKAETFANRRRHKDFICWEFNCREEERKSAY
jgi:hypothetical protein